MPSKSELAVTKMGSIKAVKASLKRGGGSGRIQSIPTDGITVRLLTEPDGWAQYLEYWNDEYGTYLPMMKGEQLPAGSRTPSKRYLVNAVVVSDGFNQDKVVALKVPQTSAQTLMNKYEKYGTLVDRDYEFDKIGEGLATTYDVTPDAPSKRNVAKYELLDLYGELLATRAAVLGEDAEDDDEEAEEEEAAPVKARGKTPKAAPQRRAASIEEDEDDDEEVEEEEEDEDEEEEDEEQDLEDFESDDVFDLGTTVESADEGDEDAGQAMYDWWSEQDTELDAEDYGTWAEAVKAIEAERKRKERAAKKAPAAPVKKAATKHPVKKAVAAAKAPAKKATTKSTKKAAAPEPEEDDGVDIDEDSLLAMSINELRALADEYGIEHKGLGKAAVVKAIMAEAEE